MAIRTFTDFFNEIITPKPLEVKTENLAEPM